MCSPNRSESTDLVTGDILLAYLCQASPLLDLAPMISTPDRVPRATRSLWSGISASSNNHPSYASTPRSLLAPSTPSHSLANLQMVSSPSPLSKFPSLCYPEISPPLQGSGGTPFERQFTSDFSRDWDNLDTEFSPVVRRSSDASYQLSPAHDAPDSQGPSRKDDLDRDDTDRRCDSDTRDSEDIIQGISLIDRFISAAADESGTTEDPSSFSTFSSQDRFSSPLSDLSDLTPLSSPEPSIRFARGFNLRPRIPSTSSSMERAVEPKKMIIPCDRDEESNQNSERELSPTRSSPQFHDQDYRPAKGNSGCKRKRAQQSGSEQPSKRKKASTVSAPESTSTDADPSHEISTRRQLPTDVPYHPQFPLFYVRFPVSSYLRTDDGSFPLLNRPKLPGGTYNQPRDALDLYTPRFVKGSGLTKVGLCPICIESPSRGGKGEVVWLSMKFSAYKCYHMQYAHGISSISARPFSPPTAFRTTDRRHPAKNERTAILEAKCHKCKKWIPVESIKNLDIKVKELYWWKHAAACHQGTCISGDDDFFMDEEIYRRVRTMDSDCQQ